MARPSSILEKKYFYNLRAYCYLRLSCRNLWGNRSWRERQIKIEKAKNE
jgi:hypothetical protein